MSSRCFFPTAPEAEEEVEEDDFGGEEDMVSLGANVIYSSRRCTLLKKDAVTQSPRR